MQQGATFNLIYPQNEDILSKIKILMVGVGGIGCEVLKMVSKFTFKEFHIIDMDTIEVSNLNRQFLFRKEHRGKYKSEVAKETMNTLSPQLNIIAHINAVGSGDYRMQFISQFDVVIMALDNQETRSYVNKVCRALGIYLLDAGSMGFKGQSNSYYPLQQLFCYDCFPLASTQKQYAACTIRQQPSNCVHCIIWAKYLFTQLFTQTTDDDESGILEVGHLNKQDSYAVFQRMFYEDIKLMNKNLQLINQEEFQTLPLPPKSRVEVENQKKFALDKLISIWQYSFGQLFKEMNKLGSLEFDKDDWIHTLFIFSSTCLRCVNFSLEALDFNQVKTISGNIIHAIASTNSIVSALEVQKMFQSIFNEHHSFHDLKGASYVSTGKRERIVTIKQSKRNLLCNSCLENQFVLRIDLTQIKMGELVTSVKKHFQLEKEITLTEKSRLLWEDEDEDQIENIQSRFLSTILDIAKDNRIVITVEDKVFIVIWIIHSPEEIVFNYDPARQVNQLLRLKVEIQDFSVKEIKEKEVKIVDQKPIQKLISLSDSEEEKVIKPKNGNGNGNSKPQNLISIDSE